MRIYAESCQTAVQFLSSLYKRVSSKRTLKTWIENDCKASREIERKSGECIVMETKGRASRKREWAAFSSATERLS